MATPTDCESTLAKNCQTNAVYVFVWVALSRRFTSPSTKRKRRSSSIIIFDHLKRFAALTFFELDAGSAAGYAMSWLPSSKLSRRFSIKKDKLAKLRSSRGDTAW
ncbi:hypothetical protein GN958_ATG05699 [Phytophthora infestans]|uniref:Uncharacterized protein n=1 Tax=Phytophthora infestans TaxID=4787 RepID=A0A8S9UVQ3_PHYIN|nr:hypothetical protein GN958_ATG05699 [Phytophthora infestans]